MFQDDLDHATLDFSRKLDMHINTLLKRSSLSISVAESLTGGLLSSRLTQFPGSSTYYIGGITAYHPRAKVDLCQVAAHSIREHTVVSEQVALEMARGVQGRLKTDLSISTTGIAGPPTEEYPDHMTGKVFIGFKLLRDETVKYFELEGSREVIRSKTVDAALGTLKIWLENHLSASL